MPYCLDGPRGRVGNDAFRRRWTPCLNGISHLALTVSLTASLVASLAPRPASAQCAPETAGSDVVCAADDTDGFRFRTTDFNSVTIDQGVTVSAVPGSDDVALEVRDVATTIINNGTVRTGGNAFAMSLWGTVPEILNSATGVIEGHGGVWGGAVFTGGTGDTVFTNRGRITATVSRAIRFDAGNQTLINSGTITSTPGPGGPAYAIQMGDGDDIVELQPGSTIIGIVHGNAGTDTLRFGGTGEDVFDLSDIDTGANTQQYRTFEAFGVVGGDWTFDGATTVAFTQTGGTIMGTGTFGDLRLDGGTIAPGNSIGTVNVTGDIAFNAGSTYQVELNAAGQSDLIAATGTATIAATGTTLDIVGAPGIYPAASPTYTILTAAGGVTGAFETITDNLPDIAFQAIYNATNVQLIYTAAADGNVTPKAIHPSSLDGAMGASHLFGETLRLRGGLVVSGGFSGGASESLSLGYMAGSGTPDTLPPHVLAADMPQVPVAAMSNGIPQPRNWAVWGTGLGSMTDVDASGGVPGWDAATGGVAFGVERRADLFGLPSVVGVAFGFTSSDVASGASDADIEGYHLGLYAASSTGPLSWSGAVSYAFQDHELNRLVPFGGGTVTALGAADGHALTAGFEAFHDLAGHDGSSDIRFGPLVTLDSVYAERDGFTETGAGILNLTVAGDDTSQAVTGLGVAGSLTRTVGTTLVTLDGRVAWQHVFGDRQVTSTSAIPAAGATFVTASAPINRDRIALGLGTALEFSDNVSAHLRYDGAFSGSTTDHRGSTGLTIWF